MNFNFCLALETQHSNVYIFPKKAMEFFKKIFKRKREKKGGVKPRPLRIEGCKTTLTQNPDKAEIAAQALLETFNTKRSAATEKGKHRENNSQLPIINTHLGQQTEKDIEYYRRLAERIRHAQDQATLRTMRFVTWCEHELEKRDLPIEGKGSLAQMEAELYKRIDTIERVGGELKHRWQHCLAEVIVRRMKEERENEERRMKNEELSESPADNTSPSDQDGGQTDPNE
jgi:hypothetical protein